MPEREECGLRMYELGKTSMDQRAARRGGFKNGSH